MLLAYKPGVTLGEWEYKTTFTFRETFIHGVSNLLLKKSHAVNLQTEQTTAKVLSSSILATKSYRVLGIQLYFSYHLKCYRLRVHPDDHPFCSLAVCYTNVTPNLGLNHRSRCNDCKLCSARALHYFYLKFSLANYAHFKSFTSWTVFQYVTPSFQVGPYQYRNGVLSIKFAIVGDLHVAASFVKLGWACLSTIWAFTEGNPHKSSGWVFLFADIFALSLFIERVHSQRTWQTLCVRRKKKKRFGELLLLALKTGQATKVRFVIHSRGK